MCRHTFATATVAPNLSTERLDKSAAVTVLAPTSADPLRATVETPADENEEPNLNLSPEAALPPIDGVLLPSVLFTKVPLGKTRAPM